jgi:hypothetical protein
MFRTFLLIIALVLAPLALGGCVTMSDSEAIKSVSISPINSLFIEERKQVDKNYKIGDTLTAYVGEPLVKKKTYIAKVQSNLAAVPAINTIISSPNFGTISLPSGKQYQVKYDVFINGKRFTAMEIPSKSGTVAVLFDTNGVIYDRVMREGKVLPESFKVKPLNAYVQMERPEKILERKTIENYEIIFGGVNNNQIKMTYREYSPDDVARTAFFQELTYPTKSRTLRYKSMKIKVINITSEGITYQVVSD